MEKIIYLLPLVLLTSCGGQLNTAKKSLTTAHYIYVEIDTEFADLYEQARINARETSNTWEERDKKLEPWENARKAIVSAGYVLKTAAMAVDVAEDGFETDWKIQIKKVIDSLESLVECLENLDVELPVAIGKTIKVLKVIGE